MSIGLRWIHYDLVAESEAEGRFSPHPFYTPDDFDSHSVCSFIFEVVWSYNRSIMAKGMIT